MDKEERGVDGRPIKVMHDTTRPNGMTNQHVSPEDFENEVEKEKALAQEKSLSSSLKGTSKGEGSNHGEDNDGGDVIPQRTQTQIKFADHIKMEDEDDDIRIPTQRSKEDHIAFLERQRNSDAGEVLRIPGPRDADAGVAPRAVDGEDTIHPTLSRRESTFSGEEGQMESPNGEEEQQPKRNITIAEPNREPIPEHVADDAIAAKHVLGVLRFRKPRIFRGRGKETPKTHHEDPAKRTNTLQTIRSALTSDRNGSGMPYLSWEPTIGRNSAFVDMTEEQREELGGIEYRSLKSLALILFIYFFGFAIFGTLGLLPWILVNKTYGAIVEADGQGRVWWGFFTAMSALNDVGYTLTPDSMISFNTAIWPLLLMSYLIVIGNTGFPIMLRIMIWVFSKVVPKDSGIWEELNFLLDHPRRCFTLLFPAQATWWLFWILVILNSVDLIFFIVLDLGNTVVTQLPVNIRILNGFFQAISTRTAGFSVVNLSLLHPAIQVSYLIMMYISALPIAISVRRTNVYEEKSLGIYGNVQEENEDEGEPSYVGAHLRRQLSFDLWFIFLGFFIVSISEGSRLQSGDPGFTMFGVLFEIVSAYGTVGLSLGYPTINASFSAEFGTIAKLVIIAMQIRGRHRGLPYELDKAILLPSEHLQAKESEDAALRIRRRSSANLAQVSSGAAKTNSHTGRDRSEGRSPHRNAQNFLSTLLHPGPTIPNSHRNIHKGDSNYGSPRQRRFSSSAAETTKRGARSLSPNAFKSKMGLGLGKSVTTDGADDESPRGRKAEGRRFFFQDHRNPSPMDRTGVVSPVPEGTETKEA